MLTLKPRSTCKIPLSYMVSDEKLAQNPKVHYIILPMSAKYAQAFKLHILITPEKQLLLKKLQWKPVLNRELSQFLRNSICIYIHASCFNQYNSI